jgi:hypothetical protein
MTLEELEAEATCPEDPQEIEDREKKCEPGWPARGVSPPPLGLPFPLLLPPSRNRGGRDG